MGYELVRSLSIDIENFKLKITCASSNVTPIKYEKFERTGILDNYKNISELTETEKFLLPIIKDVYGGMLQLQKSVSKRLTYAFLKTKYFISIKDAENNINFFDYAYIENAAQYADTIKEIVNYFIKVYNESDEKIKSVFVIDEDKYLVRLNQKSISYSYSESQAKIYKSLKEMKIDSERLEFHGFKNYKAVKIM
ncbi:hypothetical protein [Staphylococcus saprophyticus]|uniref:hypothetical protein n=1 Tax=Staphylococcus saprophyticus TaxID=29385 RepID=UPI0034C62DE6